MPIFLCNIIVVNYSTDSQNLTTPQKHSTSRAAKARRGKTGDSFGRSKQMRLTRVERLAAVAGRAQPGGPRCWPPPPGGCIVENTPRAGHAAGFPLPSVDAHRVCRNNSPAGLLLLHGRRKSNGQYSREDCVQRAVFFLDSKHRSWRTQKSSLWHTFSSK